LWLPKRDEARSRICALRWRLFTLNSNDVSPKYDTLKKRLTPIRDQPNRFTDCIGRTVWMNKIAYSNSEMTQLVSTRLVQNA
jgi:hypothetical protein